MCIKRSIKSGAGELVAVELYGNRSGGRVEGGRGVVARRIKQLFSLHVCERGTQLSVLSC